MCQAPIPVQSIDMKLSIDGVYLKTSRRELTLGARISGERRSSQFRPTALDRARSRRWVGFRPRREVGWSASLTGQDQTVGALIQERSLMRCLDPRRCVWEQLACLLEELPQPLQAKIDKHRYAAAFGERRSRDPRRLITGGVVPVEPLREPPRLRTWTTGRQLQWGTKAQPKSRHRRPQCTNEAANVLAAAV